MGKGKSSLFWELRNSMGLYKYTTRQDGEIISSMKGKKNPTYSDPDKKEARDLRIAGYGACGKVTRPLVKTLRTTFCERKKKQTPMNMFVKMNVDKLCTASRDPETKKIVLNYDFGAMDVSGGSLDEANVTAAVDLEQNMVTFTQEGEVIPGGLAQEDDSVYACLFTAGAEDHGSMRSLCVKLRDRGENGSTTVEIPKQWNKLAFFVYVYVVSNDKKYSSPSTRLYPPPTVEEVALAAAVEEFENAKLQLAIREVTATREERDEILNANAELKKVTKKAEKAAAEAGKSPFESKLAGLEAATKHLKMEK